MKIFILVIIITQYSSGVAIESIEIGSLKLCQSASEVIHRTKPSGRSLSIKTACIGKDSSL